MIKQVIQSSLMPWVLLLGHQFRSAGEGDAMNIHEYQAKAILRQFGVPVPDGHVCYNGASAREWAKLLGDGPWVVKAQIHAGGRGKGGG